MTPGRWLLLPLLALVACGGSDSTPTTPTRDWIELNSLTPPRGTAVTAGEPLTISATVTCTIVSRDGGMVGLLIRDQGGRTLPGAGTSPQQVTLPAGTTTVSLTDTVTAPPSGGTITVYVPMWVNGSNLTAAFTTASYTVK